MSKGDLTREQRLQIMLSPDELQAIVERAPAILGIAPIGGSAPGLVVSIGVYLILSGRSKVRA